jgi:hypothetical protein
MSAGTFNILCEQGADFRLQLTWREPDQTPINVSGFSAKMQVRTAKGASTAAATLSTSSGTIVLGGVNGTILLTMPASETGSLVPGAYIYDIELTDPSGVVTRLMQGSFTVDQQVTQ